MPFDFYSEFDSPATLEAIASALRAAGHEVHLVEATDDLPRWFLTHAVDLVFNIAEGSCGEHRESQVPAILETLGIPFTGSGSHTLALALNKARTKQVLAADGLPTPAWQLFPSPDAILNPRLTFPLIVKPNREGSAKGIVRESVVWDGAALRRQVRRIYEQYHQEALVEEFIEGTELTVGVLGNDPSTRAPALAGGASLGMSPATRRGVVLNDPARFASLCFAKRSKAKHAGESEDDEVGPVPSAAEGRALPVGTHEPKALPILEIDFAGCQRSGEFFYSWRLKEYQGQELALTPTFYCPARLDRELTAQVQAVAVRAHQALGCRDLSRTDIRLRHDGVPFVLEVNPLPGLDPRESNFPIMTTAAGMTHAALINYLVDLALARDREAAQTQEPPSTPCVASTMQPGQLAASRSAP